MSTLSAPCARARRGRPLSARARAASSSPSPRRAAARCAGGARGGGGGSRREALAALAALPAALGGAGSARAAVPRAGSPAEVVELTSANWDAVASSGRPVFVEFYATWCPYCNAMKPAWEALAAEANAAGAVSDAALPVVARLDADAEPDFAFSKGFAGGFPDLVLYEGGSPVAGFRGKRALPELKAFAARFGSNAGPADDLQCTARGN